MRNRPKKAALTGLLRGEALLCRHIAHHERQGQGQEFCVLPNLFCRVLLSSGRKNARFLKKTQSDLVVK